ncbi:MAG: ester cyclase [Hyphomicrobiaceae bacterium]
MKLLLVALAASLFAAAPATAAGLDRSKAQALVDGFYAMLNKPAGKDIAALAGTVLDPDWKSYASDTDFKGRDAFVKQVIGFGKLIPDLTWTVKEVLVDGDRIVVRSTASGSPTGPLFGVEPQGRSFSIMTIDIHIAKDGKLVTAHHIEDWASALRQLSGK